VPLKYIRVLNKHAWKAKEDWEKDPILKAADKAKVDYMALMLKILPVKSRALGGLPQTVSSQAEAILQSAKTECQSTATNILSKGI
jgi:hypothetical protein